MFISNNIRLCSLCIRKVLPTNIFRRLQMYERKSKNYIDMELESKSDTDSGTDSDIYIEE